MPARPPRRRASSSNPAWASMTPREREADLRARATPSELQLLSLLNLHPATRDRFKFQAHWRGYYLDFLFAKAKLVVELDGACHSKPAARVADARRTGKLVKAGYRVIRFWNGELRQPEKVMARILNCLMVRGVLDNAVEELMEMPAAVSLDDMPAILTRAGTRTRREAR